jgi:ACS family glucarate transporter-like MFS transporter
LNTSTRNLRWKLMAFIIFPLTFVMSLDRTNIAITAPIIGKEFHFSLIEIGLILTSFSWTYAFLQVPGGIMAERLGSRLTLALADLWWSIWTILTTVGWSVASFIGIRSLLGVGQAADWPASVNAINKWFPASERARANSILLGGLYLGPIVGGPLTVLIVETLGWPWAFYIYGVVGAILGLLWYVYYRDRPAHHPRISAEEVEHIQQGYEALDQHQPARLSDWGHFISNYRFWAYGFQYFFLILIQSFYTTWLPTYLVKARGFSLTSMGFASSLPWVALFIMVFVSGAWQDRVLARTGSKYKARVPFAVTGFILAAVFLILASRIANPVLMLIMLMLSLGSVGLVQVAIWPTASDLGGSMTGSLAGWTNFWGNFSAALGPIFTAFLVGLTSNWSSALLIISLAALIGALLWLVIYPDRPLETGEQVQPAANIAD